MSNVINRFKNFTIDCLETIGESVLLGMWF